MSLDVISYNKAILALRKAGFVGTKDVDETNLADGNIIHYSEELDKYISKELKIKVKEWRPNTEYEKNEIVVYDNMMHWILEDHTSHESSIDFDLLEDKIMPLAVQAGLGNILGLEFTIGENQRSAQLTWTNPTSESYDSREVFVAEDLDIMSMSYAECVGLLDTSEGKVKRVEQGVGTGLGEADEANFYIEERKKYYVKVFALHGTEEGISPSTGRYTVLENPDTLPPEPASDFAGVVTEDSEVVVTWTQPTESDFYHTRLVRSESGIPSTPTDGVTLDTIPVGRVGRFIDTNIRKGVVYYYRAFFYDDAGDGYQTGVAGNWSMGSPVELIDVPVYGFDTRTEIRSRDALGLEQESFDSHYPWSNISRAIVDNAGEIVYYLDDNDSSLQEDGMTPADLTGGDGNVVVEIPEFYYAYIDGEALLGHEEFDGSKLFPRTLVGAFEASETSTGELQSVSGANALDYKSITEYRQMASLVGSGWQQRDVELQTALQILFMIEYGGLHSQNLVGKGIVNEVAAASTGSTIGLGNNTGVADNGAISYRGIENPWGNVWEFLEGVVATDTSYYTAQSGFNSFTSDVNTGSYTSLGITPIIEDGFMSSFVDKDVFFGSQVIGDTARFTGDYQNSHKQGATNVIVVGGNYGDGDKAGLFRTHMGLRPYGESQEMELVAAGEEFSEYELEIDETDLETIKDIIVG